MVEGLPTPDSKDLELLRSTQRRNYSRLVIRTVAAIFGGILGILLTVYLVRRSQPEEISQQQIQEVLASANFDWEEDVAGQVADYREWFARHGTETEAVVFDDVTFLIVRSMVATTSGEASLSEMGIFKQVYLSLHTGLIRIVFLVLASLRACIVCMLGAVVFGLRSYKPYSGNDALGQMGNGRLFYSGVRAGLDQLTHDGAPDVQVRGFACPQFASQAEARASHIWKVLGEYGAQNGTNEALTAILVKNGKISAYVAQPEDDALMAKAFCGSTLLEHTPELLNSALSLYALYAAGEITAPLQQIPEQASNHPFSSEEYALAVRSAMSRVLSPKLRQEIGALSAAEVATTVLAFECGKVLAHSFEGGRWIKRSQFPQLSARAVLHSVLEYPHDYDFHSRDRIRKSLIYASRSSSFAPVRMPIGLRSDVWALRQWMEVLLANPHELPAVADEVELVGLVRSSHHAWCETFLDASAVLSAEITKNSFSTASGLLFVPLQQVVAILRKTISSGEIRRIEELLSLVSARQRILAAEVAKRDGEAPDHVSFDRIFPPLRDSELEGLSSLHGVTPEEIRDWSALRIVLTSYGWLARRVGDYTVPESSVIFSVFKSREPLAGANSLGLVGKQGLVPFRGAKLESRWGPAWSSRFTYADKATMAETAEDFDKLMKGIEEKLDEEASGMSSPVSA